jgi:hypothetical protein
MPNRTAVVRADYRTGAGGWISGVARVEWAAGRGQAHAKTGAEATIATGPDDASCPRRRAPRCSRVPMDLDGTPGLLPAPGSKDYSSQAGSFFATATFFNVAYAGMPSRPYGG